MLIWEGSCGSAERFRPLGARGRRGGEGWPGTGPAEAGVGGPVVHRRGVGCRCVSPEAAVLMASSARADS